jgi:hypothetical protein
MTDYNHLLKIMQELCDEELSKVARKAYLIAEHNNSWVVAIHWIKKIEEKLMAEDELMKKINDNLVGW